MSQLLQHLQQDHRQLIQLLDLFENALDQFHLGQEPDYEWLCEVLEYIEQYTDQIHHPIENSLFEYLDTHGAEEPALRLLMRQHEVLIEITRTVRQALEGIVHEEVLRRDEVEAQGREILKTLRDHLQLEESRAFPLARERLTPADWAAVEAALPQALDTLDFSPFQSLYRRLIAQSHA